MNEAQAAENSAALVAPNVINYDLPDGGGLSIEVVENNKINEAQAAVEVAAPAAAATTNAPVAADTSNAPAAETP